jgi:zinc protease
MISGKLNKNIRQVLESFFGKSDWMAKKANPNQNGFGPCSTGRHIVHKQGAVQSSIMIGKRTINKNHHDFLGLSILNTILGGYFGSRLMANLREKNALTYGIYSSLSSLLQTGSFTISANLNTSMIEKAIRQIYKEIEILQQKLVPAKEFEMVKNYLSGEMLRAFDGPMAVSEIFLDVLPYGLDLGYYQKYFDTLKTIKSETIRDLANKYFEKQSFVEVIAGNIY